MVDLDVAHVDLEAGALRIQGKGNKERLVYLSSAAGAALRAWLGARQAAGTDGPVFVPITRGPQPRPIPRRLGEQSVYDSLARRAREAAFAT